MDCIRDGTPPYQQMPPLKHEVQQHELHQKED